MLKNLNYILDPIKFILMSMNSYLMSLDYLFQNLKMQQNKIADGQRTKIIYTLIKEAKYQDVNKLQLRQSPILVMSCSFVPGADRCLYSLTATT